jgi:acetylglutamate kinase
MITIVKIGGTVLEDLEKRELFLDAFARIEGPKVLIHGGGKTAGLWAKAKGIETAFVDGRRITTLEMLEIVTMVYSGINKQLVAGLQKRELKALGLSGADDSCMPAQKRSVLPVDFGLVGDPLFESPLSEMVKQCLLAGSIPVFSPLTLDVRNGGLLNTNADTIALFWCRQLQQLDAVQLIYAFEHPGVLRELADAESKFPELTPVQTKKLRAAGVIHSGMIPKLDCGFRALKLGTQSVRIAAYNQLENGTELVLS